MRTLRPEDLFRFEQVAEVTLSPDGEWLAFERVRPGNSGKVKALTIIKQTRTDIWVAPTGGGEPAAVTAGADTGTGFFRPMWSPDGKRLAMLSISQSESANPSTALFSGRPRRASLHCWESPGRLVWRTGRPRVSSATICRPGR